MPRNPRIVSVIPASSELYRENSAAPVRLKVAAYCRVSTEQEQQQSSYEIQVDYYTRYISQNPEWELAGIYADEGISGTNTDRRTDFNRLMDDCMHGKVDLILTKSISRFARNTVDCISWVRKLKAMGIAVHFETENINTLESSGELLLAILSSQAQEESHSISTNVTWGIVRKFEKGEMMLNVNNFLGFTRDREGNIVIDQAEAAVVRKIFYLYLCGDSLTQIKEKLEAEGIKTVRGKDTWRVSTIDRLLSNEKYMGDALLQKSYTVDFLTKKRIANTGQRKQYYVENSHEAIIPKSIFYQVQAEKARRAGLVKKTTKKSKTAKGVYSSKYALTELLVCGECGTHYRRTTWNNTKKGEKKIVWRCINRLEHGKKVCKESPTLTEESLQMAIAKGLADIMYGEDELQFREELKQDVLCTLADMYGGTTPEELDQSIKALQEQLLYYAGLAARDASGTGNFQDKFQLLAKQIEELKSQKVNIEEQKNRRAEYERRIEAFEEMMEQQRPSEEYDDQLVRKMVKEIRVFSKERVVMELTTGLQMELGM